MARLNRFAAATALAAAFSLAATPAMGRRYHHHWHRWHRDRVDAGDVIAGAAIIGGIAAIASAMSKRDRAESAPPPPPVPQDRQGYAYDGSRPAGLGLDRAADMCADAVDGGGNRVDFVDNVTRDADGWAVSGALMGGGAFSCRIGNDGRLGDISVGGDRPAAEPGAWDERDGAPPQADDRPIWRGDDARAQDDGRYSASDAPDFGDRT